MKRLSIVFIVLAALLLSARLWAGECDLSMPDLVALTTDLPKPAVITHHEIALRTDLDRNTLHLQTTCTVRNQSGKALTQVDFNLLGAEQSYGANVAVVNISATNEQGRTPCQFSHAPLAQPSNPQQAGTQQFPKIVRVKLPSPLKSDAECRLQFDYAITIPDLSKDISYGLIAPSPAGGKEVNLLGDYAWIPEVASDTAQRSAPQQGNLFSKGHKATWRMSVVHPSDLQSLVLDGRLEMVERGEGTTLSRYSCVAPGAPQISIGPFERIEVEGSNVAVVFLVPKGKYARPEVENAGRFLQRAFEFYRELFGPLDGKSIHVAVGLAGHTQRAVQNLGQVGHGAFLGMFLNYLPARETNAFDEIAAHELAHSWWGNSVSSYGRGTKFLRESLANFAAWHLARTKFQRDRFRGDLALGIYQGTLAEAMFRPAGDSASQAYTKGPLVLDLLRQEMGDETFFAVLRAFAARFRDGHATFSDFVAVCNEVSRRDWLPFLTHWCYGRGLPVYRVIAYSSSRGTNGWDTTVTLTNAGQGIVSCPLELKTSTGAQRERFAVPEGASRSFVWQTATQVTNVVIDPDHITLQGDTEEGRLKLLALPDATLNGNWPLYWKGVAHGEAGDHSRAEALISRAIAMFKGENAPYAYYYSRGMVRMRAGQTAQGIDDLRAFLDGLLEPAKERPASADKVIRELAYAGLLSAPAPEEQREQLRQLLRGLTGADVVIDPELTDWRRWWREHRGSFQPAPEACRLSPGGGEANR